MSGYDLTRHILQNCRATNILIHSNKWKEEMDRGIREIKSERFMGFLPKPMKESELLQFLACKTFESPMNRQTDELLNKKNVLVLNDDQDVLMMFKMLLKSHDVQVMGATNVSDALKRLTEQKVDVILSDINLGRDMPDGYKFLKQARERDNNIPFYIVSGYSKSDEEPKAKSMGANGYL